MISLPWVVGGGGDFNEILCHSEKEGGAAKQGLLMENFRNALKDCGLKDLGFEGPSFTWTNRRSVDQLISERLDRCVGNVEWQQCFSFFSIIYLDFWRSNHRPILLDMFDGVSNFNEQRRFFYKRC